MHYIYESDKDYTILLMRYLNERFYRLYVSFKYDYFNVFYTKNNR